MESIQQATRARRLAERAGDGKLAARALLALGRSESDAGRYRRARTLLEDARRRSEAAGDLRGQGWALHRLSETWGWAGLERELDDLRSAYRLFARARDRFGRAVVANDLAYILSVEGGAEFIDFVVFRDRKEAARSFTGGTSRRAAWSKVKAIFARARRCFAPGATTAIRRVVSAKPSVSRRSAGRWPPKRATDTRSPTRC